MNQLNNYGVSERFFTEATLYPEYQLARVIAQYRGKYKIVTEQGEMLAEISGKLRYDTEELAHRIETTFPHIDGPVRIYPIGATIGCHTGPGTVALFFWGKPRE